MRQIQFIISNTQDCFKGDKKKFQDALSWLPLQEHSSILRYKYENDQQLALLSRLLRRYHLSKCLNKGWNDLVFGHLPKGKPYVILDDGWLEFNISHAGNWVVLGSTSYLSMRMGVDVVMIDKPQSESVQHYIYCFESQLHRNELKLIMNLDNEDMKLRTFYEIWACKESYIKALGVGLSIDLSKIEVYNNQNVLGIKYEEHSLNKWILHMSYIDINSILCVCCGYEDDTMELDSKLLDYRQSGSLLASPQITIDNHFQHVKLEDMIDIRSKH
ncbi:4'-phosphopantetheinyl transferase superfamily [Pilobolus umbonatus]|nr:4'-phosphopantetheinyl transferase superfamily [Pilobolus umbonatus]